MSEEPFLSVLFCALTGKTLEKTYVLIIVIFLGLSCVLEEAVISASSHVDGDIASISCYASVMAIPLALFCVDSGISLAVLPRRQNHFGRCRRLMHR